MNIEHSEIMWLDDHHQVSLDELVVLSGMSFDTLQILLESGALTPKNADTDIKIEIMQFSSHYIDTLRTLARLQQAFELEENALGLIMVFLERIQKLEQRVSQLKRS
jgi:chaperone modulatory protein CbpM